MTIAAVVQMVSSANVAQNLASLDVAFKQAKDSGATLLALPENYAFMGLSETDKLTIAESFKAGIIQETTAKLAKHYSLWVIAGTLPLKSDNNRVKSACVVYDNLGKVAARYDKIHLFDVKVSDTEAHQESLTVTPGDAIVTVDTPIGCVGLSVCYDLRFPELYRALAKKGATIFSIPSAFTKVTGLAHWDVLLKARAIENLAYVLAPNQGGHHDNGRDTYGHSAIIDPWGKTEASLQEGAGLITASIDLKRVQTLRKEFPCVEHHRLEYREES